ncbi:hypothetical protein EXW48_12525 [Bacillus wiedmannii]|nr:hypothetical protein EXW48_12525 [Bacillus wiedmannii]
MNICIIIYQFLISNTLSGFLKEKKYACFYEEIEAFQRLGRTESATFGYCIKFTKSQCFLDKKT